jgi:hypothetical protein
MRETMWKEAFTTSLRNYTGISAEGLRNWGGGEERKKERKKGKERKKEDIHTRTFVVPAGIPTWHFSNRILDYYSLGQLA